MNYVTVSVLNEMDHPVYLTVIPVKDSNEYKFVITSKPRASAVKPVFSGMLTPKRMVDLRRIPEHSELEIVDHAKVECTVEGRDIGPLIRVKQFLN